MINLKKQIEILKELKKKYLDIDLNDFSEKQFNPHKMPFYLFVQDVLLFKVGFGVVYSCILCNYEKIWETDNPTCDLCPYSHVGTGKELFCLDHNNIMKTKSFSNLNYVTKFSDLQPAIDDRIQFINNVIEIIEKKL